MPAAERLPVPARWILRLLPPGAREVVGGDIEELYRRRLHTGGRRSRLWALGTVLRSVRDARAGRAAPPSRSIPWTTVMSDLLQDLRFGARSLVRSPGLVAAVLLTLALGIGANTTIFAVVYGTVFRALPYPNSERLVAVHEVNPERGWDAANTAPANFLDWRQENRTFEDLTVHGWVYGGALTGGDRPEWIRATDVFHNFFDVMGVAPLLGRPFGEDATWSRETPALVISHRLWTSRFGRDPDVVGRTLEINGRPRTIGAVMPPGLDYPSPDVDIWDAFGWEDENRSAVWFRRAHFVTTVGRMAEETSLEEASEDLQAVAASLEERYPETNQDMGVRVRPLRRVLVGDARTPLLVLLVAVGLVLLIACANIAHLLLARATGRTGEIAIRCALGAGRWRVTRQLLTESLLLAALGGVGGALLAGVGTRLLVSMGGDVLPRADAVRFDTPVLLFATLATLAAGLAFGAAPAWQLGRIVRGDTTPERSHGASADGRTRRGRSALVLTEVALAVVLVTGALLMVRSFVRLVATDPGFDPERRVVARIQFPSAHYPEAADGERFRQELVAQLERRPSIESVGWSDQLPLEGAGWTSDARFDGEEFEITEFHRRIVDPGYLRTMGVPLLEGRWFDERDRSDSTPVAVVNETLARLYFPDSSPVGRRVAMVDEPEEDDWIEVIGVAGAERLEGLDSRPWPEILLPLAQRPQRLVAMIARWSEGHDRPDADIRAAIATLDPQMPVISLRDYEEIAAGTVGNERLLALLLAAFAAIALTLAGVGVGAMVARGVHQRRREIGVRLALGARPRGVVTMLVRESMTLVAGGLVCGGVTAVLVASGLGSLLHGIEPFDPPALLGVVIILGLVAGVATWLPARRAATIDPVRSLRAD